MSTTPAGGQVSNTSGGGSSSSFSGTGGSGNWGLTSSGGTALGGTSKNSDPSTGTVTGGSANVEFSQQCSRPEPKTCDGEDPSDSKEDRIAEVLFKAGRSLGIHFGKLRSGDSGRAGWGTVNGGLDGDQIWIERSYGELVETMPKKVVAGDSRVQKTNIVIAGGVLEQSSEIDKYPEIRACLRIVEESTVVCTSYHSSQICYLHTCDGDNPSSAESDYTVGSVKHNNEACRFELHYSENQRAAWAIAFGHAGCTVWLDRTVSGGTTSWVGNLGIHSITGDENEGHTPMYSIGSGDLPSLVEIRACGFDNTGNAPVSCTQYYP
jgi:hypothetical protein